MYKYIKYCRNYGCLGCRLYTYLPFIHYFSPCSSMVRASHWSSEGYRLYTYVTFTHYLSPCIASIVRASHSSTLHIYFRSLLLFINYNKHCNVPSICVRFCKTKDQRRQWTRREWWRIAGRRPGCPRTWQCKCQTLEIYGQRGQAWFIREKWPRDRYRYATGCNCVEERTWLSKIVWNVFELK